MKVRHPDPERIGYDVCLAQMGLEIYRDARTNEEKLRAIVQRDDNGIVKLRDGKPQVDSGLLHIPGA